MPLEQRVISPIQVSRGCVPMDSSGNLAINIPNELECVTNGSLANIIRQLSSLSRYAEDLFGTILTEANLLTVRSNALQTRIDRLAAKVTSLDSTVEEVSLQDIHLRKAFKSSAAFDQQVVARETIPEAIREVYRQCDRPPPLNKLNAYREDGKDGLKFYTDPNYFFELWCQEMLADTEKVLADKVKKVPKNKQTGSAKQRKVRPPANSRERYRQMMANQGEFIIEQKSNGQAVMGTNLVYIDTNGALVEPNFTQRPNSLELNHVTYQQYMDLSQQQNHMNNKNHMSSQLAQNYYQQQKYQQEVIQLNQYNALNYQTDGKPQQQSTPTRRQASITSRPSQPPPAPPSAPSSGPSTPSHTMTRNDSNNLDTTTTNSGGTPLHSRSRTRETLPPPPPPPPTQHEMNSGVVSNNESTIGVSHKHSPLSHVQNNIERGAAEDLQQRNAAQPPPPPPPPPSVSVPQESAGLQQRMSSRGQQLPTLTDLKSITLKKTPVNQAVVKTDARSDLLAAIREGIKLKRVEDCKQREVEKSTPLHDVASILARRVAIELSDSEGGAEDECDDDSDAWDDESEC